MQLREFQSRFAALMLEHPDALHSLAPDFAAEFEEGDIPLARRLLVYRNNIVGSLTDVMLNSFPLLEKLVGKEFLEGMARSFILKNPPAQGCLNVYGQGFAEFIEVFEPAKSLPYLPDMARLEIALNESYYAEERRPLSAADLAAIQPESLADTPLTPAPHVTLLASAFPLLALKTLCDTPDAPAPDMTAGVRLMICRPQESVDIHELAEAEYKMLNTLKSGETLGTAAESALTADPAFNFADFLQKHLALETFCNKPMDSGTKPGLDCES